MSQRHCHEIWTKCMKELEQLLTKTESTVVHINTNTTDGGGSDSKHKDVLCEIYVRYIQVLKSLATLYAYTRQPQQREIIHRTIEYCAILLHDSWFTLVKANKHVDVIDFGQTLELLRLTCDDLEIPMLSMLRRRGSPSPSIVDASQPIESSSSLPVSIVQRQQRREAELEYLKKEAINQIQTVEGSAIRLQEHELMAQWLQQHMDKSTGRWPTAIPLKGDLPAAVVAVQLTDEAAESKDSKNKKKVGTSKKVEAENKKKDAKNTTAINGNTTITPMKSITSILSTELRQLSSKWNRINQGTLDQQTMQQSSTTDGLPLPRRGSSIDAVQLDVLEDDTRPAVVEEIRMNVRSEAIKICEDANSHLPVVKQAKDQSTAGNKQKKGATPLQPKQSDNSSNSSLPGISSSKKDPNIQSPSTIDNNSNNDTWNAKDHDTLLQDLKAHGILKESKPAPISDFLGESFLVHPQVDLQSSHVKKVHAGGKATHAAESNEEPLLPYPPLSMAAVRQLVTVQCILPLLTAKTTRLLSDLKSNNNGGGDNNNNITANTTTTTNTSSSSQLSPSLLIHGSSKSGKTMLTMAIAYESGSFFFDLSPSVLAGKFPGNEVESVVHAVFLAAKQSSPSIIYIDEVEKVFILDKTRSMAFAPPGGEPPCRIRKQLLIEIAALRPSDGVFIIGNSSNPQACVGTDEKDMLDAFPMLLRMPLPNHRSRRAIIQSYCAKKNIISIDCFPSTVLSDSNDTIVDEHHHDGSDNNSSISGDLHVAACMTEGFTAGALIHCIDTSLDTYNKKHNEQEKIRFLDCFAQAIETMMQAHNDNDSNSDMNNNNTTTSTTIATTTDDDWTAHAHAKQQNKSSCTSTPSLIEEDTGKKVDRKLEKKVPKKR